MAAPKARNSEELEERRQKAFALRRAGADYRQIGKALDVSTGQAARDVKAVLTRIQAEMAADAKEHVALEIARLDMALKAIAVQVQNGGLGAIDRWVRISESRRKLLGLDAADGADRDLNERIASVLGALAEARTGGTSTEG